MAMQKTVYLACDSNTRSVGVGDGVTLWFFHVVLLTHSSNQLEIAVVVNGPFEHL